MTFALKDTSHEPPGGRHKPVRPAQPAVNKGRVAFPGSIPDIQRKPICACDGGCPRCSNGGVIQPKLAIGRPDDKYEREADRVADQVMRMPDPGMQRKPGGPFKNGLSSEDREDEHAIIQTKLGVQDGLAELQRQPVEEEEEEEELLQAKEMPGHTPVVTPKVASEIASMAGGGQPLPASERTFFELRFGRDFSQVRVHSGAQAAKAARTVKAQAFTVGRDVVFGAGEYAPGTTSGQRLLAHELTHVVQQTVLQQRPKSLLQGPSPKRKSDQAAELGARNYHGGTESRLNVGSLIQRNPGGTVGAIGATHIAGPGDSLSLIAGYPADGWQNRLDQLIAANQDHSNIRKRNGVKA